MKKFVITGAASCGKTKTLEDLQILGFRIVPEFAREILEEGVLHPKDKDPIPFQREVARRQRKAEKELVGADNTEIVFLDRSNIDAIAYCRHFKLKELPEELDVNAHYDGVFILEMLPKFENDGVRIEDGMDETMEIYQLVLEEYRIRSVPMIFVPVMSIRERAEFIAEKVKNM